MIGFQVTIENVGDVFFTQCIIYRRAQLCQTLHSKIQSSSSTGISMQKDARNRENSLS